jgi:hypothetical protein
VRLAAAVRLLPPHIYSHLHNHTRVQLQVAGEVVVLDVLHVDALMGALPTRELV